MSQLRSAVDGNYFAALGSLADGRFTGNRTYTITLTRSIHLLAGETISGSSCFYNGDLQTQDSAWVKILNDEGRAIAQPWFEISGGIYSTTPNSTPYRTSSLWTQWSWQAPAECDYAISLGMTTHGNNNMSSYGFFDDIRVDAATPLVTSVPEPSSLTLVALGAAGIAVLRRKQVLTFYA